MAGTRKVRYRITLKLGLDELATALGPVVEIEAGPETVRQLIAAEDKVEKVTGLRCQIDPVPVR